MAKALPQFKPKKAGIDAGRLILKKIKTLLESHENFAFETTLSTKSYVNLLIKAQAMGFQVTLLFFSLHSPELAESRVKNRVIEGGHDIPVEVIWRRYENGLKNFFNLYLPIIDNWMFINNSGENYEIVAEGTIEDVLINNRKIWYELNELYYGKK